MGIWFLSVVVSLCWSVAVMRRPLKRVLGVAWMLLTLPLAGLILVRRWWRRAEIVWEQEQVRLRMMPESVREGSPLLTVVAPKFVVGIYGVRRNERILLGTGWRYGGYVVTAAHVVFEKSYDSLMLHNIARDVYFKVDNWVHLTADVAVTAYRSEWQVPSAKIDTINNSAFASVYAARAMQNSSVGILKHIPATAMGFLEYTGSTLPGFSGSPYFNGNRVLGMHAGGGTVGNYGFSASFIDMSLKSRVRKESSELDMIRRMLRSARVKDVDYEQGLDETRVRIGGRYVVLDNEEFYELFLDDEYERYFYDVEEEAGVKRRVKRKQVDWSEEPDYQPEAADVEPDFVNPPSASSLPEGEMATPLHDMHTSLMSSLASLEEKISAGQQETQANLEDLFVSMLQREKKSYEELLDQRLESLNQSWLNKLQAMRLDFDDRSCLGTKASTSTSRTCYEASTQRAQPVSEPIASTRLLVTPWAGMDSDLQKFKQWRNSVDVSAPEYPGLRLVYLRDGLSLTTDQVKALIARFQNQHNAAKKKKNKSSKAVKPEPIVIQ